MKDFLGNVLGVITWLYGIMTQIMALVFFIEYCRSDDSLLEIIFLDIILSELKGIFWIFFIW